MSQAASGPANQTCRRGRNRWRLPVLLGPPLQPLLPLSVAEPWDHLPFASRPTPGLCSCWMPLVQAGAFPVLFHVCATPSLAPPPSLLQECLAFCCSLWTSLPWGRPPLVFKEYLSVPCQACLRLGESIKMEGNDPAALPPSSRETRVPSCKGLDEQTETRPPHQSHFCQFSLCLEPVACVLSVQGIVAMRASVAAEVLAEQGS